MHTYTKKEIKKKQNSYKFALKSQKQYSVLSFAFSLWISYISQKCSGNWVHVASLQKQHTYAVVILFMLKSSQVSQRALHNLVWRYNSKNVWEKFMHALCLVVFFRITQLCNLKFVFRSYSLQSPCASLGWNSGYRFGCQCLYLLSYLPRLLMVNFYVIS